ncbi:MAG: toprim domain-containing protein [Candidatus Paceibacterota bacterium]
MIPQPIKNFIEHFSRLPSVGPRMATRLAFFLVNINKSQLKDLSEVFSKLEKMDNCPKCFFVKESKEKLCTICSSEKRDQDVILIVEKETDLLSVEKSNSFKGTYLILGNLNNKGSLSDKQKLRLQNIKKIAAKKGKIKEVIIALSSTTEGDLISQTIKKELSNSTEKITKIGRGIPTGGEIEFADEDTLSNALEGRK